MPNKRQPFHIFAALSYNTTKIKKNMFSITFKLKGGLFGVAIKREKKEKIDITFREHAEHFIAHSKMRVSDSTLQNYGTALRSFMRFAGKREVTFGMITSNFVATYETWLANHGVSRNTSSLYMRSLRVIYNAAVKRRLTPQRNPFKDVFTGREKTPKRAMSRQNLRRIIEMPSDGDSDNDLCRDIFLFCLYTMGMPFVDAYCARRSQIKRHTLTYRRHKTGALIRVELCPEAWAIIKRYARDDSDFIFPLNQQESFCYRQYSSVLYHYNKILKRVALAAGVKSDISSYTARHSWASMAFRQNVGLPIIQQALGHSNGNTTMIYIKELELSRIAYSNKKILNAIMGVPLTNR